VRLLLDQTRCVGHGRCYELASGLFGEDDRGHCVLLASEADCDDEGARKAIANCPEGAISMAQDGHAEADTWDLFCDRLKEAGKVISEARAPGDELTRAEGYRYLSRLTRLALEKHLEHADPAAPTFYSLSHETAKIGCDNPDSFYQNAVLDGQFEYRVSGTRGTAAYLGIGAYYGNYGSDAPSGCSGYLEGAQLELDEQGGFELLLGGEKKPGNWIALRPDSSMLIVRQVFLDRVNEAAGNLAIERTGGNSPRMLDITALEDGLDAAAAFVKGTAVMFAEWAEEFERCPGELIAMDSARTAGAHGDPNISFYMGAWQLEEGEALLVELVAPPCLYWNFQLNNHWMESLDYRWQRIHVNSHDAVEDSDGVVRIVISPSDPGLPNYLHTSGHGHGTMGLRCIKGRAPFSIQTKRCRISELGGV